LHRQSNGAKNTDHTEMNENLVLAVSLISSGVDFRRQAERKGVGKPPSHGFRVAFIEIFSSGFAFASIPM
jgi:hypothetical protein